MLGTNVAARGGCFGNSDGEEEDDDDDVADASVDMDEAVLTVTDDERLTHRLCSLRCCDNNNDKLEEL